jgi:Cu-Zn family superoxide dismutase
MRSFFVAVAAAWSIVPGAASGQIATKNAELVGAGGKAIGTVILTQAPKGIILRVQAAGLIEGWHGMHIHSVATCGDPGFKASGGHIHAMSAASIHGYLNPNATDSGDLPNLYVSKDGSAAAEVFVPDVSLGEAPGRLNLLDSDGSALVIHAAADDHSSQPIGGAGARVACAAIK